MTEAEARQLDGLGGYHPDPALRRWAPGSCFENEGLYLYRTVRELRPAVIVEVGRWEGCSTSHLALACQHNQFGRVYSIDINTGMGSKVPPELREWCDFVSRDVFAVDPSGIAGGTPIDLLLEDGAHTTGFTRSVLARFRVRPGGRVIVHDVCHRDCQKTVRCEAFDVMGEPSEIFFQPPSDCGYGIWRISK